MLYSQHSAIKELVLVQCGSDLCNVCYVKLFEGMSCGISVVQVQSMWIWLGWLWLSALSARLDH